MSLRLVWLLVVGVTVVHVGFRMLGSSDVALRGAPDVVPVDVGADLGWLVQDLAEPGVWSSPEPSVEPAQVDCWYVVVGSASCGASRNAMLRWSVEIDAGLRRMTRIEGWRILWIVRDAVGTPPLPERLEETITGAGIGVLWMPRDLPPSSLDVETFPTTLVLDRSGRVQTVRSGARFPLEAAFGEDCGVKPSPNAELPFFDLARE